MTIRPRPSRRGPICFLLGVAVVVGILLHRSRFLIGLLFEDGSHYAIQPAVILAQDPPEGAQLIPKIIHQTYRNASLPMVWAEQQRQLLDLHQDYEYMFWTDDSARDFIADQYPWFLSTYESYSYNIQRADAMRYFVLARYGGIYLDLDISTIRRLDPLLSYPAWSCRTLPTGISNDALGSIPNHPFFVHVTKSLNTYNRNWLLPYITIMYTTGPLFLSVMWKEYLNQAHAVNESLHNLMVDENFGNSYGFFNNTDGGSWHGKDVEVILWMGRHWLAVTVLGFMVGFGVVGVLWLLIRKVGERREGYRRIERLA